MTWPVKFSVLPVSILVFGMVFSVWGLSGIRMDNEDVIRWLPDNSPARTDYDFFRKTFSSDDYVIISWPGCTIDDVRLQQFCDGIRRDLDPAMIESVLSGREVLERLADSGGLPHEQIQKRLAGVFFGWADHELTCAVIALGEKGRANRADAMGLVSAAIERVPGLEFSDAMIAGYPWLAVSMNRMIEETFRKLLLLSGLAATVVALLCMRDFVLAFFGLIVSGIAAGFATALIPACGGKIGGLTMIVPTLAFVLTMSGSLHLSRYALECIGDQRKLLRIGWLPCTVSTLTTIIGVLTLLFSNYPAVREFGAFSAGALAFSLVLQLGVLPWLLTRFGQRGLRNLAAHDSQRSLWRRFPAILERMQWPIAVVTLVLLAGTSAGMFRLVPNVEAENLFRAESEMLLSIDRLEKQIGPMDQTEALLVFDAPEEADFFRRTAYVRQIAALFARIPEVDLAYALTDCLPIEPRGTGIMATAKKRLYRQSLVDKRGSLGNNEMLSLENGSEVWRISLRFSFSKSSDFQKLEQHVLEISRRCRESAKEQWLGFLPPRLVYTGTTHLVHDAQESLLGDFAFSFVMAFVMITPVLMIVLRSFWLGVIGMFGNLVPTIGVFGVMGWAGLPIDVALGMTASVALGIAVDDTTHLMIRFRELGGRLGAVQPALQRSLQQCGPAMLHTTLIACAGIFTFWFSELPVICRFAATISALLVTALLADLFLLPATLLISARIFSRADSAR